MTHRKRLITIAVAVMAAMVLLLALTAGTVAAPKVLVVADHMTYTVESTVSLNKLVLGDGAQIVAPEHKALTLTVNGVETGGVLATTKGVATIIVGPTAYMGNVVITVTDDNLVEYTMGGGGPPPGGAETADAPPPPPPGEPTIFPFRQALYLDAGGVVWAKSVPAALTGKAPAAFDINNVQIKSTGENFTGIFVAGGEYTLRNVKIDLSGNGRSDFVGYGAGIVARGTDTRVVIDGARIVTDGVVRSAVVADKGSNVVVKNSYIQTNDGILPADYVPTVDTTQMRSVPWMLSLSGNCRATNLLGDYTKASYINSYIGAEGWGVLSTDGCKQPTLTAINSTIAITGEDGYGSYGIGDATEYFLGCTFDVATYATISRGSHLIYGDSDPALVAQLNQDLGLGLSAEELAAIPDKATVVGSDRFGIMWHGGGTLAIGGGTVFNTQEAVFLDKGQAIDVHVDGSQGAQLNPANGVILQLMDDDDPGPQPPAMTNTGVYSDPTGPVQPDATHDVTVADASDALLTFTDIELAGDFFNSARGGIVQGPFGPPASASKNLGLTFTDASITGVITASTAVHHVSPIDSTLYRELGEVINTPAVAVNNGVIVTLAGASTWTVTGTSYLTKLVVGADALVTAPAGYDLVMTVDGVATPIVAGETYTGNIRLALVLLP
jgi:hypothetical protein